jgi:SAM-dependent methyltransferase
MTKSRCASSDCSSDPKNDVNHAVAFSGVDMDMFARGRLADMLDLLHRHGSIALEAAACPGNGCGLGDSHFVQSPSVGHLSGVDISAFAIEIARTSNSEIQCRHQSGPLLPFEDASFDFCSTV